MAGRTAEPYRCVGLRGRCSNQLLHAAEQDPVHGNISFLTAGTGRHVCVLTPVLVSGTREGRGEDPGKGESVCPGGKLPPFCMNLRHSWDADTTPQPQPAEARGEKACQFWVRAGAAVGRFREGLRGPYLSIRTSSWAPRDRRTETLVTKRRLPQAAALPGWQMPLGERERAQAGVLRWTPHLLTQEARAAALGGFISEGHIRPVTQNSGCIFQVCGTTHATRRSRSQCLLHGLS